MEDQNWQGGTMLAAKIGRSWTNFGEGPIFLLYRPIHSYIMLSSYYQYLVASALKD